MNKVMIEPQNKKMKGEGYLENLAARKWIHLSSSNGNCMFRNATYGTSSKNPVQQWSQILLNGIQAHKIPSQVELSFCCHVIGVTSLRPHATQIF
jgi:hypothetical protein